jgi:hypothetical protein
MLFTNRKTGKEDIYFENLCLQFYSQERRRRQSFFLSRLFSKCFRRNSCKQSQYFTVKLKQWRVIDKTNKQRKMF